MKHGPSIPPFIEAKQYISPYLPFLLSYFSRTFFFFFAVFYSFPVLDFLPDPSHLFYPPRYWHLNITKLETTVSSPGFQACATLPSSASDSDTHKVNVAAQPLTVLFRCLTSAESLISGSLIATEEAIMCALTESDINWLTSSAQRVCFPCKCLAYFQSFTAIGIMQRLFVLVFVFNHHSCL